STGRVSLPQNIPDSPALKRLRLVLMPICNQELFSVKDPGKKCRGFLFQKIYLTEGKLTPKTMNYQKLALSIIPLLAACGQKRPEVIERPLFEVRNTSTLEIDKVELNDTTTVLHFDAFFYPNMWIMIAADTYIKESGSDERFFITKAEGINIGEHFFTPESGQTSFKLF